MNIAEAAERYMELNFKVIFLEPGSKAPEKRWFGPVHKEPPLSEFNTLTIQNALADGCNIGLWMTSLYSGEGPMAERDFLFALDFDDATLYEEWKQANPELAKSPTQKTPNGGYHVLFIASEPFNSATSERLDFIGSLWHIAVWPSVLNKDGTTQAYQWLIPPWEAPLVHVVVGKSFREALGLSQDVWDALDWEAEDYGDRQDNYEEDYYEGRSR